MKTLEYYKDFELITTDSRKVSRNSIFVCLKGTKTDGHSYIEKAIEGGARLIVVDQNYFTSHSEKFEKLKLKNPEVLFEACLNTHNKLVEILNKFHHNELQKMNVYGITGTNGKTTISHIIAYLLSNQNQKVASNCALLGTMGIKYDIGLDIYEELANTTPAIEITYGAISKASKKSCNALAMEVSSHALEQLRVAGLNFKHSVISNLTQDHLDYHQTMERYFKAKAKILHQTSESLIINYDGEYAKQFIAYAGKLESDLKIYKISLDEHKKDKVELFVNQIKIDSAGLSFQINFGENFKSQLNLKKDTLQIRTKLNGIFNIYNICLAVTLAILEGVSLEDLQEKLPRLEPISGRFETITQENKALCIVDYAHSPDGLKNILEAALDLIKNTHKYNKLICVFGCGGDRDITKRPQMAKIAYDLADFVYVTSDNPRTEDPQQIIADIVSGIPDNSKHKVIIERDQAIIEAVSQASVSDVVVVAGKGHENYQILKDKTIDFDDREFINKGFLARV